MKTVNIQVLGGSSPWTRPSAPECGDTLKALASLGGDQGNLAPGSLSTGSPAGRALLVLKQRDGSMYSQAHVRTRFVPTSSSVAIRDRGH